MVYSLDRFKIAQAQCYESVLYEMKSGKKTTHWMWYVFPQIAGLGMTATSREYAIQSVEEAKAYLMDKLLSGRYIELTEILANGNFGTSEYIFGDPDWMKFRSSLTLFHLTIKVFPELNQEKRFQAIDHCLKKYFNGVLDIRTIEIMKKWVI